MLHTSQQEAAPAGLEVLEEIHRVADRAAASEGVDGQRVGRDRRTPHREMMLEECLDVVEQHQTSRSKDEVIEDRRAEKVRPVPDSSFRGRLEAPSFRTPFRSAR